MEPARKILLDQACTEPAEGDLNFAQHQILVRDGKGEKDWVLVSPHIFRQCEASP